MVCPKALSLALFFSTFTLSPLSSLISKTSLSHHLYADDTQLFLSFIPKDFPIAIAQLQSTIASIQNWMTANLLTLNPSKTEFLLIGLQQQRDKILNPTLQLPAASAIAPCPSARNLGFIFDSSLTFAKQISSLSSSCHYHIRDLRRIRHTLDLKTASTIATSLVQSRLDYCNSLYYSLPKIQLQRLQQIQNSLARAVSRTPLHDHITPTLKSLHWLKIDQRIEFKINSITYNILHNDKPTYLRQLISPQQTRNTRSANFLHLSLPPLSSKLKFYDRTFRNASPNLWNALPNSLRSFNSIATETNTLPFSPLALTRKQFLSQLKTYLFTKSYPP